MAKTSIVMLHHSGIGGEERGQFQHRVIAPCDALVESGDFEAIQANWFSSGALNVALEADILVLQGLAGPEAQGLRKARARLNRTTLFEISDDPLTPRPWIGRMHQPDPIFIRRVMSMAAQSDGVQFSSEGLQARYGAWNKVQTVLPNIVKLPSATTRRTSTHGLVIGWAGTYSHAEDLKLIVSAIKAFMDAHPTALFALKGDVRLTQLFGEKAPNWLRHEPFGNYYEYTSFLRSIDVGVIPLHDTRFNLGRTDLKPIEMAAAGAVVVLQAGQFHSHLPQCFQRFSGASDLLNILDTLACDAELRRTLVRDAKAWVRQKRSPAGAAARHIEWYNAQRAIVSGRKLSKVSQDADFDVAFARVHRAISNGTGIVTNAEVAELTSLFYRAPDHVQTRWLLARCLGALGKLEEQNDLLLPLRSHPVYSLI